jgi:outer membrane protein assembly factor BamB
MKKVIGFLISCIMISSIVIPTYTQAAVKQNSNVVQLSPATVQKAQVYEVKLKNSPIKYPQVKGLNSKKAEQKINATLQKGAKVANKHRLKLLADEKEAKDKWTSSQGPWRPYEYVFTYKVPFNDAGKLSVVYYEYVYTGGAHGMTTGTTFNFDLNTGDLIQLSKLIKGNEKSIQDYTYQQLQKKYSGYVLIKSPNEIELKDKNRLWVFDQEGIKLIFSEYEVAAYAAGMPEIVVPYHIFQR